MQTRGRLTFFEALGAIGYLPSLYALFVGGPSILTLLQSIFDDFELASSLQGVVESYEAFADYITGFASIVLSPIVWLLNSTFGWSLSLSGHWVPFFCLLAGATFSVRTFFNKPGARRRVDDRPLLVFVLVIFFLGTVWIGFTPLDASGWQQGLYVSSAPTVLVILTTLIVVSGMLYTGDFYWRSIPGTLAWIGRVVAIAMLFVLATWLLSVLPIVGGGAGLLVLLGALFFASLVLIRKVPDLSKVPDRENTPEKKAVWFADHYHTIRAGNLAGWRMLGGFLVAAGILFADAALVVTERWLAN